MKEAVSIMLILLATILLTGCISIPLGEGEKLVIGFDGINIEADEGLNKGDENHKVSVAADGPETDDANVANDSEVENEQEQADHESCEDDYALILDDMPEDFPMPVCATITSVNSSHSDIDAYYNVEADWQDIYKLYQDYFGDNISSQSQKPEEKSGELRSNTDDFDIWIQLNQEDDDFVRVRVLHYFVEVIEEE